MTFQQRAYVNAMFLGLSLQFSHLRWAQVTGSILVMFGAVCFLLSSK